MDDSTASSHGNDAEAMLLRGSSFIHSYTRSSNTTGANTSLDASTTSADTSALTAEGGQGGADDGTSKEDTQRLRRREPTMLRKGDSLIAPRDPNESKKYTIVLDLDETVVYARDGPLYARAHLESLLQVMNEYCEVIVWTAGERKYAKAILQEINTDNIIKHLIYRHKAWFNPKDYTKDLCRLGRDLDYVLIIENTPDCVRVNPQNGIIVEDFEGVPGDDASGESQEGADGAPSSAASAGKTTPPPSPKTGPVAKKPQEDHTFVHLMQLIKDLGESEEPVPQFLAKCKLLRRQVVQGSTGEDIPIFYLTNKRRAHRSKQAAAAVASGEEATAASGKVVKTNRDKEKAAEEKSSHEEEPRQHAPQTPKKGKRPRE